MVTPELGITELETGNDGVTIFNSGVRKLEQGTNVFRCLQVDLTTPPGSEAEGDAYYVAGTGAAAWLTHDNEFAYWQNGAYLFHTLVDGNVIYDEEFDNWYKFNGTDIERMYERVYRLTINTPSSEDKTFGYIEHEFEVVELDAICVGSTPSVDWTVRFASDRNATGTELVTGGATTTSTTTVDSETTLTVSTVTAGSFLWLETSSETGTVTEFHVTVRGLISR